MLPASLRRPVYYGCPMLVGVSTAQVVSWGILYYAFSVFITPMEAELGWPRVALTGAYSLALLCSGLSAVPVGRWLDRHGPRALMSVGSLLAMLLVAAWSQVRSLPAFYLIMAGIGVVSAGGALLYVALFGAGSGVLTIMRAALLAEHYGPANYGTINGAQSLALTGARTVAPVGAGLLVSALGGYEPLLWGLVSLLILGAGAVVASEPAALPAAAT